MWEEDHLEAVGLEQPGFVEEIGPRGELMFMLPSFKEGEVQKPMLNKRDESYWGNIVQRMNTGDIIWVHTKSAGKVITIGLGKYNRGTLHIIDGWPPGDIPAQRLAFLRRVGDAGGADVVHVGHTIQAHDGMHWQTRLAFLKAELHGDYPFVLGFPSTYGVFYDRLQIIGTALKSYYEDMADDGLHVWNTRHMLGVYMMELASVPLRGSTAYD